MGGCVDESGCSIVRPNPEIGPVRVCEMGVLCQTRLVGDHVRIMLKFNSVRYAAGL